MKKITLSMVSILLMGGYSFAGGKNGTLLTVPIAQVQDEVPEDYFYGGVALVYQCAYAKHHRWFQHAKTQDEIGGVEGILGYNYNRYLAVEGRIHTTFIDRDFSETYGWEIFLKPQYQFLDDELGYNTDYYTVYGLLGYGGVHVDGYLGKEPGHIKNSGKTLMDDTSFQWGFGLSYTFVDEEDDDRSGDWSIFAEYNHLIPQAPVYTQLYGYDPTYYDELSDEQLAVGFTYRF